MAWVRNASASMTSTAVLIEADGVGVAIGDARREHRNAACSVRSARAPEADVIPAGVEIFVAVAPIDLRWEVGQLASVAGEQFGRNARSATAAECPAL